MPNWFVAIPIEGTTDYFTALRTGAPGSLRWLVPEDIHLTVAFFGAIRDERYHAVESVLTASPPPDFRVTTGSLMALPSARHFSAVSLSLVETSAVAEYAQRHHATLMSAAGLPPDSRRFLPHITVARPPRKTTPWQRREILNWLAKRQPPPCGLHLRRMAIYRGVDDNTARRYSTMAETVAPGASAI